MTRREIKWQRVEPGWYRTEVNGVRYEILNMQGESIRYSGVGSHWILSRGGEGDLSLGRQQISSHLGLADAKIALEWHLEGRDQYGRRSRAVHDFDDHDYKEI